jgi:hypothetical protein
MPEQIQTEETNTPAPRQEYTAPELESFGEFKGIIGADPTSI